MTVEAHISPGEVEKIKQSIIDSLDPEKLDRLKESINTNDGTIWLGIHPFSHLTDSDPATAEYQKQITQWLSEGHPEPLIIFEEADSVAEAIAFLDEQGVAADSYIILPTINASPVLTKIDETIHTVERYSDGQDLTAWIVQSAFLKDLGVNSVNLFGQYSQGYPLDGESSTEVRTARRNWMVRNRNRFQGYISGCVGAAGFGLETNGLKVEIPNHVLINTRD